ncbi:hypothetical protein Desor_1045 [Desulfosporosinus orientis DSM 765]|uniref:Divergent PAP2 family protein n=1 Tax=Desulfosporosinus orientis (strain ATCC 19365 / DSM 765 / NCIMB 8382 / VKM B-1628 / Singapore I) TaxID=768706 RepID=G7W873_DESOD|nr:divergent PAP2 family protein [Desulfosporosinus orientis]AET66719.1 hypothetical protein Desor_1045 [Desulfosporosinus orientis DSM 765]
MPIIPGIFHNTILNSALVAWFCAQFLKLIINLCLIRKFDIHLMVSSGGFPSSHSAIVSALSLGIGRYYGWDSPMFAAAAVFSMIVLYDAAGVRRAAGKQAEVLNQLVERLYHGPDLTQERLKELIGHTPLEVFGGVMVGIVVGLLV